MHLKALVEMQVRKVSDGDMSKQDAVWLLKKIYELKLAIPPETLNKIREIAWRD